MSNKKSGNQFEAELCEILAKHGFWVHNLAQNSAGQPADVIAVKNGSAYLIDCKVCSNGRFALNRIEENQALSMELWRDCGNGNGWFALKFGDKILMVSHYLLQLLGKKNSSITEKMLQVTDLTLEKWLEVRS